MLKLKNRYQKPVNTYILYCITVIYVFIKIKTIE